MPQQWKDSRIISIYKKKGDRAICGNSRGIFLLSVSDKVLARILLKRLSTYIADKDCPESLCGFRRERGTVDMIFVKRQPQEKAREQNRHLCMAFIDLQKAFDTVNRRMLWHVMQKFGCPPKFVAVISEFHDNMTARVSIGGEETDTFGVEVGVKQGSVIVPVIFNVYLAAATFLFRQHAGPALGVGLTYRMDGGVLNLRRIQAATRVQHDLIMNFSTLMTVH